LSGAALPGPVKRIEMTLSIAGQVQQFTIAAQPNQSATFTWDGRDAMVARCKANRVEHRYR